MTKYRFVVEHKPYGTSLYLTEKKNWFWWDYVSGSLSFNQVEALNKFKEICKGVKEKEVLAVFPEEYKGNDW